MKKLTLLFLAAAAIVGCQRTGITNQTPNGETGTLTFKVSPSDETFAVESGVEATESYNLADFYVNIEDAEGNTVERYDSYTTMPDQITLEAGTYTIEAANGKLNSAAFDSPWYYGSKTVTVEVGKTTLATIDCAISNVKVTVNFTDKFNTILEDVTASVSSIYDNTDPANPKVGVLHYTVDETRAGWFVEPYNNEMKVYVTGTNIRTGADVSFTTVLSGVEARQWRNVNLDIKTSGDIVIDIVVDETITEMPDTNIVVPDDNDILDNNGDDGDWNGDGNTGGGSTGGGSGDGGTTEPDPVLPTIEGAAFGDATSSAAFNIDEVVNFDIAANTVMDVLIESETGIENLFLTIESKALVESGLLESVLGITGEIDLANPTEGAMWVEMFSDPEAGINIIDPNVPIKGKTSHTFSTGGLMSMLAAVGIDQTHKFHLRVVDENGETTKTLTVALSNSAAE